MGAQDYRVKEIKLWPGDAHPTYGSKLSVVFEGIGEPIDMTAVKLPVVGEVEYGEIKDYKTKSGNLRQAFKRVKKEESSYTESTNSPSTSKQNGSPEYWTDKDASIRSQWAIGQSVKIAVAKGPDNITEIQDMAIKLFNLVEVVKQAGTGKGKDSSSWQDAKSKFAKNPEQEGAPPPEPQSEAEYQSLLSKEAQSYADDDKIDLSEIPF